MLFPATPTGAATAAAAATAGLFVAIYRCAIIVAAQLCNDSIGRAVADVTALSACYFAGLYVSLLIYPVFLSPLNRFPGPIGARVSNFYFSARLAKHDAYKQVLKLHQDYGDFVRIGSNGLSIIHPKAVSAIYGLGTKCRKAPWYDLTQPMVSMQTTRNPTVHAKRRRDWSVAFSDKALRGYEERIKPYQDKIIPRIPTPEGQPANVTKWFSLYSFDVMGDLAYGKSFDMLESSEEHWAIRLLNDGIEPQGWMLPVRFFRLMVAMPKLGDDWWRFIRYSSQNLEERMKTKVGIPDIMSALLEPWKDKSPSEADMRMLRGDSQLIVVAGSDTTATTLTHVIYELCRNPAHIARLHEEMRAIRSSNDDAASGDIQHKHLQYLEHLNGVIYETLRLHPPVPTALQRLTPPEGLDIAGTYIPGNTTVWCPQYALGRSEKAYVHAEAFMPERWYTSPSSSPASAGDELIKERSAWAPFSAGTYACIGRPLALMNIRTTIARLVMGFEFGFAPREERRGVEEGSREHFTIAVGELKVVFRRRK